MRDELEKLIVNAALNGCYGVGQRVLSTDVISATLTSIINLVDKEVIKDDEVHPIQNYSTWKISTRNKLRKEQRAIIRSNK